MRLLASIYSRLVLSFTSLHAIGCYRMIEQVQQKDFEQQLQVSPEFTPRALHLPSCKMGMHIIHSADSGFITTTPSAASPEHGPPAGIYVSRNGCRPTSWADKLLIEQSILINSNLRRSKAGLAAAEDRVDQHKVLLRAQQ